MTIFERKASQLTHCIESIENRRSILSASFKQAHLLFSAEGGVLPAGQERQQLVSHVGIGEQVIGGLERVRV